MALDMTGPGTGGAGILSSLGDKMMGRGAASHAKVSKKHGFLDGLYLSQLIPALLLMLVGTVTIWSASLTIAEASFPRHLLGIALGLVAAALVWRYDYRNLAGMTTALLVITCFLMLMPKIPGLGVSAKGMTGWVKLPFIPLRFQPVELGKISTIFLMASASAQYNGKIESFSDYCRLCATLLLPLVLIVITDLGSGLVVLFLGATVIICSGAKRSWVLATVALIVGVSAVVVITSMVDGLPHVLKDYQLKRLLVFADSSIDPSGDGYNLQQAKIAIGSGGFLGKGLGNATQAGNGFLPEAHTDFVFALFAEQFGFVGSVVLLALFAWMIFATILLAMRIDAPFAKLVLVGCAAMWTFQVLENVGMCIGIMPITGIPLPFISFGSSSMIAQVVSVGIVQSVWRHRQKAA